jgi:hypothetical protein
MAYRVILSSGLPRQNIKRDRPSTLLDKISKFDAWIVPIIVVLFTLYFRRIVDYIRDNTVFRLLFIATLVLVAVALHIVRSLLRRHTHNKEKGIVLYSLGIQFVTILSPISDSAHNKMIPSYFLPRDSIVDCIVTEIVRSYNVESIVALRVRNTPPTEPSEVDSSFNLPEQGQPTEDYNLLLCTRKAREGINKIVHIFPDVQLTYMECLKIRSQINQYLLNGA